MTFSKKTLVRMRDWAWKIILWIEPQIDPAFTPRNRSEGVTRWKHHEADVESFACECGIVHHFLPQDIFHTFHRYSKICGCGLGHWRVAQ